MAKDTARIVRARARHGCEYCRLPEAFSKLKFSTDHIIARQHGGHDGLDNLALACGFCNRHKGPNVAGIDALTGQLVRLFHPREQNWDDHFQFKGPLIVGKTLVGTTTIAVLALNHPYQIAARTAFFAERDIFEQE